MNGTKTTNLDAVKDYIAENGVYSFIFCDWLDMEVSDVTSEVRDALDQYGTFEEIFDNVLYGGMNLYWKRKFLEEVSEYLSEDDIQIIKNAYAECESSIARRRMEGIREFAEQVKGKTIMVSYFFDDDSFSVGFRDVTPVIDITDNGYCFSVDSGNANLRIQDADIIHYEEDEEEEDEEEEDVRNWYGFILDNDTRVLVKIDD